MRYYALKDANNNNFLGVNNIHQYTGDFRCHIASENDFVLHYDSLDEADAARLNIIIFAQALLDWAKALKPVPWRMP